ncbi:caspase recruitment domain-containing protein 19 isoform X1 [Dromiciops gliroides]|uniref:caspase recruitment domain-containing protein 19 isoform X1 n=1 Tax=Dromiciops gliroides TaxID=33562 RepID=UPI001CC73D90|nr:caspase recruitment domain-containing protein 19 isoform X1 [Dromiciops gliroides]
MFCRKYQTYCDRLVQDTPFLTSNGRLSEQQVDKIILQLNRFYPQILTNKEAEKFRNPKTSVRVRLSDLLTHLQRKGERDCQEFYRALYINAQHLYGSLPSRKAMKTSDSTELDPDKEKYNLNDRGPMFFLACFSVAAGLAFLFYYCSPDPRVLRGTRRVIGFSPIIIGKHVSHYLLAYLEKSFGEP